MSYGTGTIGAQGPQGAQGNQGLQGAQGSSPVLSGTGSTVGINSVYVAATETVDSRTYTNLATVGPEVIVTTGTSALVIISAMTWKTASAQGQTNFMSFEVTHSTAGTTHAADDSRSASTALKWSGQALNIKHAILLTNLTAGSNTFRAKYRSTYVGPGSGNAGFNIRNIMVIPL